MLWSKGNIVHTLIISGGSIEVDLALLLLEKNYDHIIAVDGGLGFCMEQKIRPTRIVGDFDTLPPKILKWYREHTKIEIRKYNPVKDATDTQIAVELALELGSQEITILGGTGTRLDHVLGNIQTLYMALEKGVDCRILDGHNRIRLIRERWVIKRAEQYGTYFSLIPYTEEVYGVTLKGAKYPLRDYHFTIFGTGSLGVSNEIMEEQVEISIKKGILILIESKD
ncbi:MAG: thiamine diphosphokinase [Lachnospiraceae bacterium]|nr:thiamine diphosphokinase [Lachnospiraceae bacterium]